MKLAKKGSGVPSVSYDEALETALCYGWIDGQKLGHSAEYWLQRFTPRSRTSIWSKRNKASAETLIATGKMKPAGLREVERAKADGRWEAAYDSATSAGVPPDFQAALDANIKARDFFDSLDSANRYALLFRIQTAKKAETRAKRIVDFISMLERNEKVHP
jgi:uncharacterized protein YdeI (YjbR/CyaY-like superfamily)